MIRIILILSFSIFSSGIFACSAVYSTSNFIVTGEKSPNVIAPNFKLSKIYRGRSGAIESCADLGTIVVKLVTVPEKPQDYIFEIVKGKFEGKLFESKPIVSMKVNDYIFHWLDGNTNSQEEINIIVKITAVNISGEKSKPQYLPIKHEGVKVPWWNIIKRLPSSITQVIE